MGMSLASTCIRRRRLCREATQPTYEAPSLAERTGRTSGARNNTNSVTALRCQANKAGIRGNSSCRCVFSSNHHSFPTLQGKPASRKVDASICCVGVVSACSICTTLPTASKPTNQATPLVLRTPNINHKLQLDKLQHRSDPRDMTRHVHVLPAAVVVLILGITTNVLHVAEAQASFTPSYCAQFTSCSDCACRQSGYTVADTCNTGCAWNAEGGYCDSANLARQTTQPGAFTYTLFAPATLHPSPVYSYEARNRVDAGDAGFLCPVSHSTLGSLPRPLWLCLVVLTHYTLCVALLLQARPL